MTPTGTLPETGGRPKIEPMTDAAPPFPRWRFLLVLALGIIGFGASVAAIYATPIAGVTDLGCGIRALDCSDVLGSRWGKFLGLPLGIWGGFYFAFWTITFFGWNRSKKENLRFVLTLVLAIGSTASLTLLALLFFVIDGNCLFCLLTHSANLGAALLLWPSRSRSFRPDTIIRAPRELTAILILSLLIGLSLFELYQLRVDRAEAASLEKTIW